MPRREDRGILKPLNHGATRVRREAVSDDPNDKRTWSEEQRWDGMKVGEFAEAYRNAGVTKRRKMRTYMRRIGDERKRRRIREIEREG